MSRTNKEKEPLEQTCHTSFLSCLPYPPFHLFPPSLELYISHSPNLLLCIKECTENTKARMESSLSLCFF